MIKVVKVVGESMSPALEPGQYVFANTWQRHRVSLGDIVVIDHPFYGRIVKRIRDICPVQGYKLSSDNPNGLSSEALGWVSERAIVGKVFSACYTP